ncbi:MAG: hypothetical protein ACR2MT_11335 [Aurantibacter sp.]
MVSSSEALCRGSRPTVVALDHRIKGFYQYEQHRFTAGWAKVSLRPNCVFITDAEHFDEFRMQLVDQP